MHNRVGLGALFWVLTIEFFLVQYLAQASYSDYSLVDMDISLLGATSCDAGLAVYGCSPHHFIFNTGMIFYGVLVILGAGLTRPLWPVTPLTLTALCLLAFGSGVGAILIGAFPVDVWLEGHLAGAVLTFLVASLGLMAMAAVTWQTNRAFALYSLATGVLSLLAAGLYLLEIYLGLGRGAIERVAAWSHTLWYIVAGILILRGHFAFGSNPA